MNAQDLDSRDRDPLDRLSPGPAQPRGDVRARTSWPDPRGVFLRAIAAAASDEELEDLRALALAHPGNGAATDVERAIATRRGQIGRNR